MRSFVLVEVQGMSAWQGRFEKCTLNPMMQRNGQLKGQLNGFPTIFGAAQKNALQLLDSQGQKKYDANHVCFAEIARALLPRKNARQEQS
jgi:hypothetical protein